jgi:short subunit dehydrogenase-like uncharacterized protein
LNNTREFEVILWGASGFTGSLVAQHLVTTYGRDLNWAMAGRNLKKLEAVRAELGRTDIPIIEADSHDDAAMEALALRTSVICTTVGPYALYGTPLVAACAQHGTHYCDLTGEVQWMGQTIRNYQSIAEKSGARIVHTCGFDSIPSDLGVLYTQQQMLATHNCHAQRINARVGKFKGSASGGTIASMMVMMEQMSRDKTIRQELENPYSINPIDAQTGPDGLDDNRAIFDENFHQWTSPFVMAAVNARVVRRSNALAGFPYGKDFGYDERQLTGDGARGKKKAKQVAFGSKITPVAMAFTPIRKLASRFLPKPGEGPSPDAQRSGHFEMFFHAQSGDGQYTLRTRVSGDRDPGYGATSRMLGESAVSLARDALACGGGIWTPATALGQALINRLEANAGIRFETLK